MVKNAHPPEIDGLWNKAIAYLKRGEANKAHEKFRNILHVLNGKPDTLMSVVVRAALGAMISARLANLGDAEGFYREIMISSYISLYSTEARDVPAEQCLAFARTYRDLFGQVYFLTELAEYTLRQDHNAASRHYCAECLELLDKHESVVKKSDKFLRFQYEYSRSECYWIEGEILKEEKQYDAALGYFQKALDIETRIGATYGLGLTYRSIADIHVMSRVDLKQAHDCLMLALECFKRDKNGEKEIPDILHRTGLIYYYRYDFHVARRYLEDALEQFGNLGNRKRQVHIISTLVDIAWSGGDGDEVERLLARSIQISKDGGDGNAELAGYLEMATFLSKKEEYSRSILFLEQALALVEKRGDKTAQFRILGDIGLYKAMIDTTSALVYIRAAERLLDAIPDNPTLRASFLNKRGLIFQMGGASPEARKDFLDSLSIYAQLIKGPEPKLSDYEGKATVLANLGMVELETDPLKSYSYCKAAVEINETVLQKEYKVRRLTFHEKTFNQAPILMESARQIAFDHFGYIEPSGSLPEEKACSERSRVFLVTAERNYRISKTISQVSRVKPIDHDYSSAIIQYVKTFENEVGEKFLTPFKRFMLEKGGEIEDKIKLEKNVDGVAPIVNFIVSNVEVELGRLRYFIQTVNHSKARKATSVVMRGFEEYLSEISDPAYITDESRFYATIETLTRFRNPSAHTGLLSFSDLEECREFLLGSKKKLMELVNAVHPKEKLAE